MSLLLGASEVVVVHLAVMLGEWWVTRGDSHVGALRSRRWH